MAQIHMAAGGHLTRALVADVLAEFDTWADDAERQAANVCPDDPRAAARFALQSIRADLMEQTAVRLAITLATFGITAGGESSCST